jgi:hypothetical protein
MQRPSLFVAVLLFASVGARAEMYGGEAEDGAIVCTLQLIFLIGWSPAPTQPQPLKRGSATHSLKDALQKKS